MVNTRSNRMGDWRKLMACSAPPPAASTIRPNYTKQLKDLNALPRVDKSINAVQAAAAAAGVISQNTAPISDDLIDTAIYAETPTPPRFGVELLPHQKRGLTWMLSVEDESSPTVVKNGTNQNFRVFGGILADKPGTGKTILMIALLKSNPARYFFNNDGHGHNVQNRRSLSKATLILCPRNIVDQWAKEIERCDASLKVVQITTAFKLHNICSLEVALADVILLPYHMLADPQYITSCQHIETLDPPPFKTFKDLSAYRGILTRFHFHRIVYDEVHEIYDQTRGRDHEFVPFMETFHSNWRWGITGTPPKSQHLFLDVLDCIARANIRANNTFAHLKSKIVRSSNPDLNIPTLTQEIRWIDLSPQELAIYNLFRNSSVDVQLMACSHFNVNQVPISRVPNHEKVLTIDELSKKLQASHTKKILKLEKELPIAQVKVPKLEAKLVEITLRVQAEKNRDRKRELGEQKTNVQTKLTTWTRVLTTCTRDIPRLTQELRYYKNILDSLQTTDEQSCVICFDEFIVEHQRICLTGCGHIFCEVCITRLGPAPCPTCREPISPATVMRIKPQLAVIPVSANVTATTDGIPSDIFGSKIQQVVLYIGAQLAEDPTFKFLIFVQYSKLARLVTEALLEYKINSVNLCGALTTRAAALKKFFHGSHPVILMSSEQSVSGVNINCASHVIILHPFNLATDEQSVAAEQQGIARAHRLGQTRPVSVVRFVSRGTVEEFMTRSRIRGKQIEE